MQRITLHFSEALVRRSVRAFWWRKTGWSFFLALAVVVAYFLLALSWGDRSWRVGVSGAAIAVGVLCATTLYFAHYRASLRRFRRMPTHEATLELTEERFRASTGVAVSEFEWSAITEILRFDEFWLVFFSPAQFMTLPTADLSPDARELILRKVEAES